MNFEFNMVKIKYVLKKYMGYSIIVYVYRIVIDRIGLWLLFKDIIKRLYVFYFDF